jgi:Ni,Fe-hydrogenase III small subunit/ferredoxin
MFGALKVRISQGRQYIPDLRRVTLKGFRGLPVFQPAPCPEACHACVDACPAAAISVSGGPVRLDLGRCMLCGECAVACPEARLSFSTEHRLASSSRDGLVVGPGVAGPPAVEVSAALARVFGRSLRLRQVSAGGCAGCELELNALSNVNFDVGRYGIEFVASPRHADALVLSGPVTRNMSAALELAYEGMPDPKFVIACGACAISGGPYAASSTLDRAFLGRFAPSLYVPGCPPHPLTFVSGILDLLGIDLRASPAGGPSPVA